MNPMFRAEIDLVVQTIAFEMDWETGKWIGTVPERDVLRALVIGAEVLPE